jgi:hypothetical protein
LAWVLSCEKNKNPRHKKRAVATTPSLAGRSRAALKDGAMRPNKKHYAGEGKAIRGREKGA